MYLHDVVVNFTSSGRVTQEILDFYIDNTADGIRRSTLLLNAYAISGQVFGGTTTVHSTSVFPNLHVGIANYETNDDATVAPAILRLSGYVATADPQIVAVFFHSINPFFKHTDEGSEINCTDSTGKVKCYFQGSLADDVIDKVKLYNFPEDINHVIVDFSAAAISSSAS